MSKLPPKPKGPVLLQRVLFTSVLGAGCSGTGGNRAMPPQVAPPPQPPQPYYEDERDLHVEPPADAGPSEVLVPVEEDQPPQIDYADPPPQVAPPPDDEAVEKRSYPPQINRRHDAPQVAPRPTPDNNTKVRPHKR